MTKLVEPKGIKEANIEKYQSSS